MRLPKFALACALFAFAAGISVLFAWHFEWWRLIQPTHDQLPEVPLAGLGICLAAAALGVCTVDLRGGAAAFWSSRVLAALLMLIGVAVMAEHLFGIRTGVAQLLFAPKLLHLQAMAEGGTPSAQTAMSLMLFGLAVWFYFGRRGDRFDLADVAAAASFFSPAAALLSYAFNIDRLGEIRADSFGMSPLAALTLALLAAGLQSLHPRRGLASLFAAQPDGGIASRRMLLAVVLVPLLFGYLQVRAIRAGVIDVSLGVAITVAASILVFIVLILWNAQLVVRLYVEQRHQLALREEKARQEAATDSLTQLFNRRGWEQCLLVEEMRCQRENLDACVIAIDLDGLKAVNDQMGHARGDEMLRKAAQALRGTARRRDVVARLGGDEFAFLATEVTPDAGPIVVERLRKALQSVEVSASMGCAPRSRFGNLSAAAQIADQAMYDDKRVRKEQRVAVNAR